MSDDNLFDDSLFDDFEDEEVPPFEEAYGDELLDMEDTSSEKPARNRTFAVIVGIIFAFFVLIAGAIAAYVLLVAPRAQQKAAQEAAMINAQNTATSVAATEQVLLLQQQAMTPSITPTEEVVLPTTPPNTPTSVVIAASNTPTPQATEDITVEVGAADFDALTATVGALLTIAAGGQTATPSALPTSGFADDVGLPGLLGMAVMLVAVIFLVRRLRSAANSAG